MSHLFLQHYWWLIISILGSILVFMMFVQGGQSLLYKIGKTPDQRTLLVNTLGRKWELTFTTLVTFGGALFAAFPLFYATSFGGAYWLWISILFCFVIQAVSYEFRSKPSNILGAKTFEVFLMINGFLGTTLIGVAVASFFTGSDFTLNEMNNVTWHNETRGLELLLDYKNLALGLSIFALSRILASMYFIKNINDKYINENSKKTIKIYAIPFVALFLLFLIPVLLQNGLEFNPETMKVSVVEFKYFNNLIQMPAILIVLLAGVIMLLYGIYISLYKKAENSIFFAGLGSFFAVLGVFLMAGFNNTCFYPSNIDMQSSLNIINSSSSLFTLKTMSIVSIIIPFVLAYIVFAWRSMNKKKVNFEELEEDGHKY